MAKVGKKRQKHVDASQRNIGALVEKHMNEQQLTCVDVAKRIGDTGKKVSSSNISYTVTGTRMPTQDLLAEICNVLNIDISHAVNLYYRDLVARGACRKEFVPSFSISSDDLIANAKAIDTMLNEKIACLLSEIKSVDSYCIMKRSVEASFGEKLTIVADLQEISSRLRTLSQCF